MRRSLTALLAALLLAGCGLSTHQTAGGSVHPPGWGKPIPSLLPHVGLGATPTRVMFDTTTPAALAGLHPTALAGYTAGAWPNFLLYVRGYPLAVVKSVAIGWGYRAHCLDVEPLDAVPAQVPAWIAADRAAGFKRPCIYSSLWEFVNQVRPILARAGIARSSILEWDADFRGCNGSIDPSFDATQCTDKAFGRNLDESVVTLAFLGIHVRPVLPLCFTHRIRPADCLKAKAQLQLDRQAASGFRLALVRADRTLSTNHCRSPWRRGVCVRAGRARRLALHRITDLQHAVAAIEAAS